MSTDCHIYPFFIVINAPGRPRLLTSVEEALRWDAKGFAVYSAERLDHVTGRVLEMYRNGWAR